jgi:hypothetical protein
MIQPSDKAADISNDWIIRFYRKPANGEPETNHRKVDHLNLNADTRATRGDASRAVTYKITELARKHTPLSGYLAFLLVRWPGSCRPWCRCCCCCCRIVPSPNRIDKLQKHSGRIESIMALVVVGNPTAADDATARFRAVIRQLDDEENVAFDGNVDLLNFKITNNMAEELGRALVQTQRVITTLSMSVGSLTANADAYPTLLDFFRYQDTSVKVDFWFCGIRNDDDHGQQVTDDSAVQYFLQAIMNNLKKNVRYTVTLLFLNLSPSTLILLADRRRSPVSELLIYTCSVATTATAATTDIEPKHNRHGSPTDASDGDSAAQILALHYPSGPTLSSHAIRIMRAFAPLAGNKEKGSLDALMLGCHPTALTKAVAQHIIDVAKQQSGPQHVSLRIEGFAGLDEEAVAVLTQQPVNIIARLTINYRLVGNNETFPDQGSLREQATKMLRCLQHSTIQSFDYTITQETTTIWTGAEQAQLDQLMWRNIIVPFLLSDFHQRVISPRFQSYMLPYALKIGSAHKHFHALVVEFIAANAVALLSRNGVEVDDETKENKNERNDDNDENDEDDADDADDEDDKDDADDAALLLP